MDKKPKDKKTKIWVERHFADHPYNNTDQDSRKVFLQQQRPSGEDRGKLQVALQEKRDIELKTLSVPTFLEIKSS
jgi:hypothetical protein